MNVKTITDNDRVIPYRTSAKRFRQKVCAFKRNASGMWLETSVLLLNKTSRKTIEDV